jgi:hypothetical protein
LVGYAAESPETPEGRMDRARAGTADGVGPGLTPLAVEMAEIADEAQRLGRRLARLCALARVTGCPDPEGLSIDELAVVADAVRGWAEHLAGRAAGRSSVELDGEGRAGAGGR